MFPRATIFTYSFRRYQQSLTQHKFPDEGNRVGPISKGQVTFDVCKSPGWINRFFFYHLLTTYLHFNCSNNSTTMKSNTLQGSTCSKSIKKPRSTTPNYVQIHQFSFKSTYVVLKWRYVSRERFLPKGLPATPRTSPLPSQVSLPSIQELLYNDLEETEINRRSWYTLPPIQVMENTTHSLPLSDLLLKRLA